MSYVPSSAGTVIFVGAGPGNPDLLTVRARDVLGTTAVAYADPQVLPSIRRIIASELEVPVERLRAAEAEYEAMCERAREAGARRKPPRN